MTLLTWKIAGELWKDQFKNPLKDRIIIPNIYTSKETAAFAMCPCDSIYFPTSITSIDSTVFNDNNRGTWTNPIDGLRNVYLATTVEYADDAFEKITPIHLFLNPEINPSGNTLVIKKWDVDGGIHTINHYTNYGEISIPYESVLSNVGERDVQDNFNPNAGSLSNDGLIDLGGTLNNLSNLDNKQSINQSISKEA